MSGKKRVMPVSRFGHGRSNDLAGHGHHNAAALEMGKSPWIKPIYEVDPNSDEMLWEPWTRALRLRPEAWQAVLQQADEDIRLSLIFLMALQNINEGASKFREDEIDAIDLQAPDLISNCIAAVLPVARPELVMKPDNLSHAPVRSTHPGRNDPCSCGSARKYKQCCGKNWQVQCPPYFHSCD